jgi:hypothetical protein
MAGHTIINFCSGHDIKPLKNMERHNWKEPQTKRITIPVPIIFSTSLLHTNKEQLHLTTCHIYHIQSVSRL